MTQISQALPGYAVAAAGREDGQQAGEFCPIFYRAARFTLESSGTFWFSDTPTRRGRAAGATGIRASAPGFSCGNRAAASRFLCITCTGTTKCSRHARKVRRCCCTKSVSVPQTDPVIVMGDFNAEADTAEIARLSAADSPVPTSALRAVQPEPIGTFHGFTGEPSGTPIDHIFVSL